MCLEERDRDLEMEWVEGGLGGSMGGFSGDLGRGEAEVVCGLGDGRFQERDGGNEGAW